MLELAHAAGQAPGGGAASFFTQLPFLLAIFAVFYFLLIRPQQKKQREHRLMLESLKTGDQVLTSGGIYGTIVGFGEDNRIKLKIAENVKIEVARDYITAHYGQSGATGASKGLSVHDLQDGALEVLCLLDTDQDGMIPRLGPKL